MITPQQIQKLAEKETKDHLAFCGFKSGPVTIEDLQQLTAIVTHRVIEQLGGLDQYKRADAERIERLANEADVKHRKICKQNGPVY